MTDLELDEILTLHWPRVMRRAMRDGDAWAQGFAMSIARHGKRQSWRPSTKQARIMRRMVNDLATVPNEELELIER
ncbi:hypothetical protein [Thalassovita sp.]|uniref:hypothetical protein n=1 Tax=Thalassovita sp. TaxID=1979401 RepID=UPI002AAF7742|nr:hypothetical protein [Thalassovita sp.]